MHWKAVSADTVGTINKSPENAQFLLSKTNKRISAKEIEKRENKDDKQIREFTTGRYHLHLVWLWNINDNRNNLVSLFWSSLRSIEKFGLRIESFMNRTVYVVLELNNLFVPLCVEYFKQESILSALNLMPSDLTKNYYVAIKLSLRMA